MLHLRELQVLHCVLLLRETGRLWENWLDGFGTNAKSRGESSGGNLAFPVARAPTIQGWLFVVTRISAQSIMGTKVESCTGHMNNHETF